MNKSLFSRIDWISMLIYLGLVIFGITNIYSTTFDNTPLELFNPSTAVGKQVLFFVLCFICWLPILFVNPNFFDRFALILYVLALFALIGLFVFGTNISGATSWYLLGGISLQPSEFAKMATVLLLANNLSKFQSDLKKPKTIARAFGILSVPALLILLQPDAGSALVFFGLVFVLFREGLSLTFLLLGFGILLVFILTLLLGTSIVILIFTFAAGVIYTFLKRRYQKLKAWPFLASVFVAGLFSFSVSFVFENVFEQRHRDRFNIVLGLETDSKGIGYNINQSKIAIGSGGWIGKGFLNGTQTKGGFVPEQHTDYIFSTVGEEWGFLGSSLLIISFAILIIRMMLRAEKQTHAFRRIYAYGFACILFIHFSVNIGMTLGLVPTVGIPLPFISYGGSSLLAFSMMFFIYINLDANRLSI